MKDYNTDVCILLGLWGENFIHDFFDLSLPSLLAPGNIPALANIFPTRFVFLTRLYEIETFKNHKHFKKLQSICPVEFIPIDDLIVFGNYSTTLTLAYDRAIKQTGEKMLDTYFVFLTSDYIMADGSLEGLMRYIAKGYSGICAGNFQVNKEKLEIELLRQIDPTTGSLSIKPRELLRQAFENLHTIVYASMLDQRLIRNYHANRFFLRFNNDVLVGQFYLLHMLCIKPETMDYQIGSSCDYSFIPEMCPSGNMAIINDSDDYLVVEIQPRFHELSYIKQGEYEMPTLVRALGEWTTKQHRKNSEQTIYYHTKDLNETEKHAIQVKLSEYTHPITVELEKIQPVSHRNHPYWIGAIETFHKNKALIEGRDYEYHDITRINKPGLAHKIYFRLFGMPPNVYRWHYRWREYKNVIDHIHKLLSPEEQERTIALYSSYEIDLLRYSLYLQENTKISQHYYLKNLLIAKSKFNELQNKPFAVCLLFIPIEDLERSKSSLKSIKKLIQRNGKLIMLTPNLSYLYGFEKSFATTILSMTNNEYRIDHVAWIYNNFTKLGAIAIENIKNLLNSRISRGLTYILLGIPISLICLIRNCIIPSFHSKKKGACTTVIASLSPNHETEQ